MKSVSLNSLEMGFSENMKNKEKNQKINTGNIPAHLSTTDSCTQTSKTILQLAKLETDSLTPDSLMQSPRNPELCSKNNHLNIQQLQAKLGMCALNPGYSSSCYTLDGSVTEHNSSPIVYTRKNHLKQYLDSYKPSKNVPSNKETLVYPKKSLTETFLSKKKYNDKSATCNCRSAFLQQTSPLRNLSVKSPKNNGDHFKSRSCIEQSNSNCMQNEKLPGQISKFTVKGSKQKTIDNVQTVKSFWSPTNSKKIQSPRIGFNHNNGDLLTLRRASRNSSNKSSASPTSSTYMSPTIASEQRNQAYRVQNLKNLISPTRRGKSQSPNGSCTTFSPHLQRLNNIVNSEKIPYIDQSQSQLTVDQLDSCMHPLARRNISYRGGSPIPLLTPMETKPRFDEDLLKLDLQSLHVKLSEDNVCGRALSSCSSSVTSCENAVMVAMSHVRDPDWSEALKGLAEMIELCRMMDRDLLFHHMTAVNQRLLDLLRSPRSHVCRTACQAAGHLFECMKDTRRPEFDDIVENLLYKTADANKFIRKDANLSLDCMVTHIPFCHSIRSLCLKGPSHKNAFVRTATIRLIVCAVVIAGPGAVLNASSNGPTRKRIILHMAKFLTDKNLETRKYGERLYKILSKETLFETYLKKYMEKEEIIQMKLLLKNKNHKKRY